MPRLQALIDEIDRWILEHGPVVYDGVELYGDVGLKFRAGERMENYEVHQSQKTNGSRRKNPARKERGDVDR